MSKKENEQKVKKSKKGIIIGIIIFILIMLTVGGFFLYQYLKSNQSIEEDWGQTYYVYLKKAKKNPKEANLSDKMKDAKLKFVEVKNREEPVMMITYKEQKKEYTNIYFIEENQVNTIVFEETTNMELLYNIEKKEYDYYIHIKDNEQDHYQSISSQIENSLKDDKDVLLTPDYTFSKAENEDEKSLLEFDKVFVKTDIEEEYVDFDLDFDNKELKDAIEESINNYEPQEDLITDKIQDEVNKRKEEIESQLSEALVEEMFTKLQGVWYYEPQSLSFEISYRNNKKYFILGWFASEAALMGEMKDISYKDNIYKFTVSGEKVEINTSNINNKKATLFDYTYTYVAKDMDKAYEKLLN